MNQRLIKQAILLAILPVITTLLTFRFWGSRFLVLSALMLGTAVQVTAVRLCKQDLRRFIHPTDRMMEQMGAVYTPIAYEPGKYQLDARVAEQAIWLSIPAPLLAFLSKVFTQVHTIPVLNFAEYTGPNFTYLSLSLACTLLGAMALCFWACLEQASVIYNEPSERRRYLLHGFADALENKEQMERFRQRSRVTRPMFHQN